MASDDYFDGNVISPESIERICENLQHLEQYWLRVLFRYCPFSISINHNAKDEEAVASLVGFGFAEIEDVSALLFKITPSGVYALSVINGNLKRSQHTSENR